MHVPEAKPDHIGMPGQDLFQVSGIDKALGIHVADARRKGGVVHEDHGRPVFGQHLFQPAEVVLIQASAMPGRMPTNAALPSSDMSLNILRWDYL